MGNVWGVGEIIYLPGQYHDIEVMFGERDKRAQ